MSQITENIFLGDRRHSESLEWLKKNGITHIVNCAIELENVYSQDFTYLNLDLIDHVEQSIFPAVHEAYVFIYTAITKNNNNKILIHCHAGISRSSTVVIYYVMQTRSFSFMAAYNFVKDKHPSTNPNIGFGNQIITNQKKMN
jgi:dual specificity MAP kinase phosphatase